jgi:poly(3-hydroxybutyrate) depolymerase
MSPRSPHHTGRRSRTRLHRRLGALAAALVTAAVTLAGSTPAQAFGSGLPRLNITGTYVTGISSGGFMASQLQVAYSGTFQGAGIFAAGPYNCGNGNVAALATQCGTDLTGLDVGALEDRATALAAQGRIDPVANLAGKPVYTYHGELDPLVSQPVSNAGVAFYQHFGANTRYHAGDEAGHGWPSPAGFLPCAATAYPFLINCGDDPEGEMLTHWLGSVNAPNTGTPTGTLGWFDQDRYVPGGWGQWYSMASSALSYIPRTCAAGAPCKLVVALHGCASDTVFTGDNFPKFSYLDNYADTNNLVVLYPQTSVSAARLNPSGCWDWWGFDGGDYAQKSGPQMRAIMNMVHAIGG